MISILWRWNRLFGQHAEAVRAWNLGLAEPDVARLCRSVGDDFLRYGPLQGLLEDPGITEIIVNGGGVAMDARVVRFLEPHVFVERAGRLEPCPYVRFDDADHLRRIIDKIAEQAGMRCDEAHAMGCAMLPGGKGAGNPSCLRLPRTVPRSTFACSAMTP